MSLEIPISVFGERSVLPLSDLVDFPEVVSWLLGTYPHVTRIIPHWIKFYFFDLASNDIRSSVYSIGDIQRHHAIHPEDVLCFRVTFRVYPFTCLSGMSTAPESTVKFNSFFPPRDLLGHFKGTMWAMVDGEPMPVTEALVKTMILTENLELYEVEAHGKYSEACLPVIGREFSFLPLPSASMTTPTAFFYKFTAYDKNQFVESIERIKDTCKCVISLLCTFDLVVCVEQCLVLRMWRKCGGA